MIKERAGRYTMSLRRKEYIDRLIDKKIEEYLSVFGAVSIEGPKWCGKTWASLNHANSVVLLDEEEIKDTYDEPFLAWPYGPVAQRQNRRFRSFGCSPIIGIFDKSPKYEPLNPIILHFLKIDLFKMVDASHTHKFWKENRAAIKSGRRDIKYPLDEVLR